MRQTRRALPPPSTTRRRGSSLMEVLVSISILVIAAVILTQFALRGMDESAMANRRAKAFLLAQDRMEDILAHRDNLAGYEVLARRDYEIDDAAPDMQLYRFKPRTGDDFEAFRWRWQISPVEGRPGLREVSVWVHWRQPSSAAYRQNTGLRTYVAVHPDAAAVPAGEAKTK